MKFGFALFGAALFIAGCSSPTLVGTENLAVVSGSALPPPARVDISARERAYLIGPFDRLSVDVFGVGELSKTVQADASGRISLPLIGVIEAAGNTPNELAVTIAERLRGRYVRDPQVTVNLVETVSQVVTVSGQVEEPGQYPVIGRMTLMRAVAKAKGTTEFARQSHVVVFRTVNEKQMAALYDLRAIHNGLYDDPEIYADDVIVVGESQSRRIFQNVIQGSGLLTAPIIALIQ